METLNTTTENNRLIAEFLGYKLQTDPTERFFGWYKSPLGTWTKEIDLPFRTDWNWLMQVVEKIESLKIDGLSFNFQIEKDMVFFYYTHIREHKKQIEMFFEWGQKTKIGNTYKIAVEFIKWYNQQNK